MINTGQMVPWSRQHFNFLPVEIWCYIFSSYPPYSTVLLNLTVTQLAKKYKPLMEFKHPQPCCQGPAAEFNPQSVYSFTFLILLSHLTLVTIFNNKKIKKKTEACKLNTQLTSQKCVISIEKNTGETSNYFYAYFKKQDWTIESFLLRWWCTHIQSSSVEHIFPKYNKCIILEVMWQFVCFHVSMNESHYHIKHHTDPYNYSPYCVFYAYSFWFSERLTYSKEVHIRQFFSASVPPGTEPCHKLQATFTLSSPIDMKIIKLLTHALPWSWWMSQD